MKSKHLLLMLLLAFMAPWAANAQSPLTIGTGTDYSGTSDGLGSPMGRCYYYNSATQFIYTAEELASMGGAKAITSVAFYHNAYSFTDDVRIYLAHTTATTVDVNNPATTATEVYYKTGVTVGGTTAGWQTFEFDNPFNYNGTDNLLVIVCRTKATGYSSSQAWQYTETTDNKFMLRHADNTAYANIANTSYDYTASTKRPNIQIAYEEPATCFKPQNLAATLTPGNGTIATLTWERNASGTEEDWVLEYGTAADFTGATSVPVSGRPSKDLTGLTAETKYYARVKPDCDTDGSKWSDVCSFTPTNALTVTVGDETATSSNAPIRSGSGSQTEFVYPASMLTALNGQTLTSVKFYASTTTASYTNKVTVYMQEVAETTESTSAWLYDQSTATKVYEGTTLAVADGEMVITFSTPYEYAGGNLCFNVWAATSAPSVTWKGFNPGYVSCGYDYYITPPVSNPWGTEQFLPKATFEYESNLYPKPKNLAARNVTNNSATLAWEAPNTDVQSYKYQYRPQGGTWNELTSTTALSAPLTGLTGNTTYEFQVQAIYAGNNESTFASTTFTTECDAYSIAPTAYTYGFEDAADLDCWELVNGVTNTGIWDNATMDYNFGYEPARTGDNVFMFYYVDYDDTDPQYQTLISPELTDVPETGVHVEFYYVGDMDGSGQETFRVGYSLTNKDLTSFVWDAEVTNVSDAYQRFSANYPAGTKYVAIQHTSDDQYYLFLDDITFEGAASCLEPTGVTASNITTTGADISWTPGGSEGEWALYVTTTATDVPDDTTTPTVASTDENPHTLTGLTPATTYYVYVRGNCRENSAWSTPAIFHTECEGMDLPYGPYSFEDGALSVCWNVINTNTSYNSLTVSESNANTGTHSLSFFRGATTGDLVAVLPVVGAYNLSDYQFELSAMGAYAGYEITVGIMTDPEDLTTFVAQGDVITTTTSYAEHKVRFNEYTGTGKYVAIKVVRPSTVTYGNTYIDDIAINLIPSCIEPDGLAVSNETAHGATFAWTAGAATQTAWQLYISTSNVAPANDIDEREVIAANSNPFTVTTGLDPENNYYAWVRANCGGTDGYSMWVGPVSFTTGIACPAPTDLAANNVTAHTADLSWNGTSESYKVMFRTAAYLSSPVFNEEFNTSGIPTGWSISSTALTDDVLNGTTTITTSSSGWSTTSYGLGTYNVKMNIWSTSKYWLITPSTTLGTNNMLSFDAAITAYNSNSAPTASNMANANSRFVVLITTDDQATWTILREWNNTGSADVLNNISNTGNNFSIDLSSYAGETVKIAFYGGQTASGPDCDLHIDNVMIGEAVTAGAWVNRTTDELFYQLTNLAAETKYEAKVQGNCGTEGMSQETASIFFTTDIACPAPTGLTASNPTSTSIELTWTNGGAANWILALKKDGDADFTEMNLSEMNVTVTGNVITYTLGSLLAETGYTVKVRDNCEASVAGDGVSEWTTEVSFSTIAACSALNPVVSNITHYTATVNWEGESASGFTVKYREAAEMDPSNLILEEGFEDNGTSIPTGWTHIGSGTLTMNTTSNRIHEGTYSLRFSGATSNNVVVLPDLGVEANTMLISFWSLAESSTNSGTFQVGYVTDATDASTFHTVGDYAAADQLSYTHVENVSLASAPSGARIAFRHTSVSTSYWWWIDDVVVGAPAAAGAWQTQPATATTANLTGLTAGTLYDVKVVPNCDETQESTTVQFTTKSADDKWFLGTSSNSWTEGGNWEPTGAPTLNQTVTLYANATIDGAAEAKKITTGTYTLTIADGGKLKTDNTVTATVIKHIDAWSVAGDYANSENPNGYYLISNPTTTSITPSATNGLLTDDNTDNTNYTYDLYEWNYQGGNGDEWRNYRASTFNLTTGLYGYLYANVSDVDLTFTGTVRANNTAQSRYLSTTAATTYDFPAWYLIGNPFMCDAYLVSASTGGTNLAYYRMNDTHDGFAAVTGAAIAPMEGIFYQATSSASVYMSRTAPAKSAGQGTLNINLTQNVTTRGAKGTTDNAIIRFGEGNTLEKFSFREGSSKVYIPQENKDYAVVNAENVGEMPVSFKAEKNGSYTLSFTNEDVTFSYLHLIDNLTGADVDLLETPAYTFDARTSDYASRFKLVFATGNVTEDNFAYFNNGSLIVNNDGKATLQVVDVMGRILSSETINGSANINVNAAAGVYVIRLINGENVKTQKIVVR